MNNIKVGTFVRGTYLGSQNGAMQFVCAYRSGSVVWFLGTEFTVGTLVYNATYKCKRVNNSLNWSDACACSWTVYLYLKSGTVTVENCKIPTYNEANMVNRWVMNNGFVYWTSTKQDDSHAYDVNEDGHIGYYTTSNIDSGVVPLAKISL